MDEPREVNVGEVSTVSEDILEELAEDVSGNRETGDMTTKTRRASETAGREQVGTGASPRRSTGRS